MVIGLRLPVQLSVYLIQLLVVKQICDFSKSDKQGFTLSTGAGFLDPWVPSPHQKINDLFFLKITLIYLNLVKFT